MTAASLETSVPVIPMATPMSAVFEGGGVVARRRRSSPRRCPGRLSSLHEPDLVLGRDARDHTDVVTAGPEVAVRIAANSVPVIARPSMPSSSAMAAAVVAWSPVIIRTWMPAEWHSAIAALASARGGSTMPDHRQQREVFDQVDQVVGRVDFTTAGSKSRWATTITRWPALAIRSLFSSRRCRLPSVIATLTLGAPDVASARRTGRRRSLDVAADHRAAPARRRRSCSWNVAMNLYAESNGTSPTRG